MSISIFILVTLIVLILAFATEYPILKAQRKLRSNREKLEQTIDRITQQLSESEVNDIIDVNASISHFTLIYGAYGNRTAIRQRVNERRKKQIYQKKYVPYTLGGIDKSIYIETRRRGVDKPAQTGAHITPDSKPTRCPIRSPLRGELCYY